MHNELRSFMKIYKLGLQQQNWDWKSYGLIACI